MQPHGHMFQCFCVRKRVGRTLWGHVCRFFLGLFFLGLFFLGLPALLPASQPVSQPVSQPASGTVRLIFHPNYHLEDIKTEIDNVASDGLHPAVFKVQVRDHRDIAIPDVEVDWSVSSDKVEVSAGNTDPQGYSWALLRSGREGTFDVTASWHNELGMFSEKTSSVTFKKSASLFFTNKTVSMKFGAGTADVQSFSGGNGGEITYSSSCPEVADFNESDPKNLTLKKVGVTMITATEAGSEQFSEQSASYGLKVNSATGPPPKFGRTDQEITVKFDDTPPQNQATAQNEGSVTYASDREDVATVDENDGTVTLTGVGTARITATEIANNYEPASASYMLKVTPGVGSDIEFDPDNASKSEGDTFSLALKGGNTGAVRSYKSDRDDIATVTPGGDVTAKKTGLAKILAREVLENYEAKEAVFELTVESKRLDVRAPSLPYVGNVAVEVHGADEGENVYLVADSKKYGPLMPDHSGVVSFCLPANRPGDIAVKVTQGNRSGSTSIDVQRYWADVTAFIEQGYLKTKIAGPKLSACKGDGMCPKGWTDEGGGCSKLVGLTDGSYPKSLEITDEHTLHGRTEEKLLAVVHFYVNESNGCKDDYSDCFDLMGVNIKAHTLPTSGAVNSSEKLNSGNSAIRSSGSFSTGCSPWPYIAYISLDRDKWTHDELDKRQPFDKKSESVSLKVYGLRHEATDEIETFVVYSLPGETGPWVCYCDRYCEPDEYWYTFFEIDPKTGRINEQKDTLKKNTEIKKVMPGPVFQLNP